MSYGASKKNWETLSDLFDLTEDLLPTVSHPKAPISANSALSQRGKVPSLYNNRSEIVGIRKWTSTKATDEKIEQWKQVEDYGICIQTRNLRAWDVDIEDKKEAEAVRMFLNGALGAGKFSIRYRADSTKFLVPFFCEGRLFKKVVKTKGGMVEWLAQGQQFVAYGTHPSGSRYIWENEYIFPTLSEDKALEIWQHMCDQFGIAPAQESTRVRKLDANLEISDDILPQLLVNAWGQNKEAQITCPFEHEHTTPNTPGDCVYFPAGTNGYAKGHFKCMHAHCQNRTDNDFITALGIYAVSADEFEPMVVAEDYIEPPKFKRNAKGFPLGSAIENIDMLLSRPDILGVGVRYDRFLHKRIIEIDGERRRIQDEDLTLIKLRMERDLHFTPIPFEVLRKTLSMNAAQNSFDSFYSWAIDLKWDGKKRVSQFFNEFARNDCHVKGYPEALGRYIFTAMAGRALRPGIKADISPVLVGGQGIGKSTLIRNLAPAPEMYVDLDITMPDDKRIRATRGCAIAEMGEMRNLFGRTQDDVKSYMTRPIDIITLKFEEEEKSYPRRNTIWGTSNNEEMFTDATGDRRFAPITLTEIHYEEVAHQREQLWAEAVAIFKEHGIMYAELESLQEKNNVRYRARDPWQDRVTAWLCEEMIGGQTRAVSGIVTGFSSLDILTGALSMPASQLNTSHNRRVGEVMTKLGYHKKRVMRHGQRENIWVKG